MSTQRVIWVVNPTGKEHAYVSGPMHGDGSICGRATYQGEYKTRYPYADVCSFCERTASWDGNGWTWDDKINSNNKEKSMATAKTNKKTDHEIIAEELLKAAEKYQFCSAFFTEMKKLNDKLETKFPDNLLSPKRKVTFYFDHNTLHWENAPTTKNGDVPQKTANALQAHINKALKEAIASWEGGGTLSGDLKVYIEEIYDNY